MKHIKIILMLLCLVSSRVAYPQIGFENIIYLKAGTILSLDSLSLLPSNDADLVANSLRVLHTAIPGKPGLSINKIYLFDNVINFKGEVGIIYRPSQLNGNPESLLELANSSTDENALAALPGSVRDFGNHYISNTVSNLDIRMLTLVNGENALPVTLVTFDARREENGIQLSWQTSFETNSDVFEVQRSKDAKNWQSVDRVRSLGEGRQVTEYGFTDENPIAGINYYRLKMVDRDETFAFSQIRKVAWERNGLVVFPNPASERLEIEVKDWAKIAKVTILNAVGNVMTERKVVGAKNFVQITDFGPGNYILKVHYRDGSSERRHFVKH